jgi:excisionase family DNA binding protein
MHLKDFPDVLTVLQLAQVLGIGKNAAYTLVQNGTIGHLKVGRKYLVPKRCVLDYLNSPRYNSTCNGGLNPTVAKGDKNDRKPAN